MSYTITTNISAATITEPSNKNYLKPNSFKFIIQRLPNVEYFCQATSLPKIALGAAAQPTPLTDVFHPGEKMDFDPLDITFIVDENMMNYLEIHNWMIGLGFPKSHDQFAELTMNPATKFYSSTKMLETAQVSDASLFILDSNSNPVVEVRFYDCFPLSLQSLDFDLRIPTVEYFTGIATFRYTHYEILPVNDPVVSVAV